MYNQFQSLEMYFHSILVDMVKPIQYLIYGSSWSGVTKAEPGQQCDEMPCQIWYTETFFWSVLDFEVITDIFIVRNIWWYLGKQLNPL